MRMGERLLYIYAHVCVHSDILVAHTASGKQLDGVELAMS